MNTKATSALGLENAPTPPVGSRLLVPPGELPKDPFERFWMLSLDLFFIASFDGYLQQVNPALERANGRSARELRSLPFIELVHPDDRTAAQAAVARLLAGEPVVDFEVRVLTVSGRVDWIEWTAVSFPVEQQIYAVGRDITAQRATWVKMRELAAIVESSDDAIIAVSLDKTITAWNGGAERMYGYAAEEVVGRPFRSLLPPERAQEMEGMLERTQRGETFKPRETERVSKDGQRLNVMFHLSAIRDINGQIVGIASIAHDITALKRLEAERLELTLRDRLARQANDAFAEITRRLAQSHDDLPGTLQAVAEAACKLVGADFAAIATPVAEGILHVSAVAGERANPMRGLILRPGTGIMGKALAAGTPLQTENYLASDSFTHDPVLDETMHAVGGVAVLAVPIQGEGQSEGVLIIGSRSSRHFTDEEVAIEQRLTNSAAVAIRTARLQTQEQGERSQLHAAERREAVLSLTQRYERKEVEGIAIHTQPGACAICQDAARDIYMPALLPPLPLVGCTSVEGCRCTYTAPGFDPHRRPPPVPAEQVANLSIPGRLQDAARFGFDPKGNCSSKDLADYLQAFPLLPFATDLPLHAGEVAYLMRTIQRAWESPDSGLPPGLAMPFDGSLRTWVKELAHAPSLPGQATPTREKSALVLTNWRLVFARGGSVDSVLLADVKRLEYFRDALACTIGTRASRLILFVDDVLQVGMYIARAIADIESAQRQIQSA